jgi:dTMP kinase
VEVEHGRLDARADVEDAAVGAHRSEERSHDVADVDEVTRLQAVAEDRRLLAALHALEEDRDHAPLQACLLSWAVDVRQPQDDMAGPVDPVPAAEVLLAAELRDPVRGQRVARGVLRRRPVALAVDRAAGRGEDDLRAGLARRLQHAHGPEHVDLRVEVRPAHRGLDVGLGGEVEDDLGVSQLEAGADVALLEPRRGVHVLAFARGEVVDDDDLVASGDQGVDEMRADEPGAPCHDRAQGPYPRAPVFITFEGIDGSGKSTQARLLAEALAADGRDVVATREPGGTDAGERIRELILGGGPIAPWTEAALFAAARAQLVDEVIAPALARGADVICDRYLDSSLAYQGIARGLGIEHVLELNAHAIRGILPDRTFLLLVDPEESARRVPEPGDRIEREAGDFRARIAEAYRELAAAFPERIVALDGTRPPAELAQEILEGVRERS